jgi:HEAT repeat protein
MHRQGIEMYLPALNRLLSDSSWWVRSQAAQAILAFANGQVLLKNISVTAADPYARDIANEWWGRGGGRDERIELWGSLMLGQAGLSLLIWPLS